MQNKARLVQTAMLGHQRKPPCNHCNWGSFWGCSGHSHTLTAPQQLSLKQTNSSEYKRKPFPIMETKLTVVMCHGVPAPSLQTDTQAAVPQASPCADSHFLGDSEGGKEALLQLSAMTIIAVMSSLLLSPRCIPQPKRTALAQVRNPTST